MIKDTPLEFDAENLTGVRWFKRRDGSVVLQLLLGQMSEFNRETKRMEWVDQWRDVLMVVEGEVNK